jgi:hypothetical protein
VQPEGRTVKLADTLRDRDAQLRVVFLTFIGAGIELIPSIPFISSTSLLIKGYGSTAVSDPTLIIVGVLVFPIIYGISASLVYSPKRIVPPVYIQALTVTFATIIFVNSLFQNPPAVQPLSSSTSYTSFLTWFFFVFIAVFIGRAQGGVVRVIVGMNGGRDDIESTAYNISGDFEVVSQTLQKDDFLDLGALRVRNRSEKFLLLSSSYKWSLGDKLVFALEGAESNNSVLTVLSYKQKYYTLCPPSSSLYRDSLIITLEHLLKQINQSYAISAGPTDTEGSRRAFIHALKITRPSLAPVKNVSRYHQATLIAAALIGAIMTGAFYYKTIGLDLYISSLVLIFAELAFVFLPLVKEAMSKIPEATDGQ